MKRFEQCASPGDFSESVYNAFYSSFITYLISKGASPEEAQDLIHDLIFKLRKKFTDLKQLTAEQLLAWCYTALYRLFLDLKRRETKYKTVKDIYHGTLPKYTSGSHLSLEEYLAEVYEYFKPRLSEQDFIILKLRIEGYRIREIAEMLGIPQGTVGYKSKQLLQQLRDYLLGNNESENS